VPQAYPTSIALSFFGYAQETAIIDAHSQPSRGYCRAMPASLP